jgi:diphthine synthase
MAGLIFVGLGLTRGDLTQAAREAIEGADDVIAEFYTSKLVGMGPKDVAQWLGRPIRFMTRHEVEGMSDAIIEAALKGDVAFLCGGDAMTATTHSDLRFKAMARGVKTRIVHGVSIQTAAAGEAGLHSYKFGRTTTLVMEEKGYLPESPYEVIAANLSRGLHTLVLLDLRAEEGVFMRTHEAAQTLLKISKKRNDGALGPETLAVALARVGSDSCRILVSDLEGISRVDLGEPLHCLILPGNLHFTEEDALAQWRPKDEGRGTDPPPASS